MFMIHRNRNSSEMSRFLRRIALFLAVQLAIFLMLLSLHDPRHDTNYLAAIIDKHRTLEQVESPRIIVIGGSNAAFGINSHLLQTATGRRTINHGLVVGFGLEFLLNEASAVARPGDLLLLCPEYDLFSGSYDTTLIRQVLEYRPASIRYFTMNQVFEIIGKHGPSIVGAIVRRSLYWHQPVPNGLDAGVYSRSGFNVSGDFVGHKDTTAPPQQFETSLAKQPNPRMIERLQQFVESCHARGIEVALSFPPQPIGHFGNGDPFGSHHRALKEIPHLKVLDTPREHAYEPQLFFDSGYHLTTAGAKVRTEKIARALQATLAAR